MHAGALNARDVESYKFHFGPGLSQCH